MYTLLGYHQLADEIDDSTLACPHSSQNVKEEHICRYAFSYDMCCVII